MNKTKKYFIMSVSLLMLVAIIFLISANANNYVYANAIDTTNKITVVGKGEQTYNPDTAYVTIGIETLNSSVTVAQQENATIMNNVIEVLKNNNILEEDIKTTSYRIFEKYDTHFGDRFMGNQVSNYIEFKTKDIDNLSSLLATLTENGVNSVNGIRFCIEDTNSKYNEVLALAINNAKSKAEALTNNTENLVATEIIEEYSYYSDCYFDSYSLAKDASNITNISAGEVKICASVRVVFEQQ